MSRPGAILIPLLLGFLVTFAVLSWRPGGWPHGSVESTQAMPPSIQARRSSLRVVQVDLSSVPSRAVAATSTATPTPPVPPAPDIAPDPVWEPPGPPAVPTVDPANSREQLEAPARKFARGGNADGP